MPEVLSPSSLNTFFKCPRRWLYEHQGKSGVVVDEGAILFGKVVHSTIEEYFRKVPETPTIDEIEKIAQEVFERNGRLVEDKKRFNKICRNFIEFEINRVRSWKRYKPLLVEEKLKGGGFVGVIDFYGEETVIDWKTGNHSLSADSDILRQGKIYEMILRENQRPVKRIIFYSLENKTIVPFPQVSDGWIYREVERMKDMVEKDQFPANWSRMCRYCPFQLDCSFEGECYWRMVDE